MLRRTLLLARRPALVARSSFSTTSAATADVYRRAGHLKAALDPLKMWTPGARFPEALKEVSSLSDPKMEAAYCGVFSVQAHHLSTSEERAFFNTRVEGTHAAMPADKKESLLKQLAATEAVDHFLAKKFPSLKRYGCEGTESAIVSLEHVVEIASTKYKTTNVVFGMPHRGRLNFLINALDYPASKMFAKIKGIPEIDASVKGATNDVLSHLAASTVKQYGSSSGSVQVNVSLLHNPSHLEAVNPVAMGKAKAKADRAAEKDALCVLVHGDAAFAGQGVVFESLQLMNLSNFSIGGTVHVVVNNQLGFTTDPRHSKSTPHSADLVKGLDIPVIHVNADHPEEVMRAVDLALEYRYKFHKDVVVDIVGYRRWGHNEVDEPSFTQPQMYAKIKAQPSVVSLYANHVSNGASIVQSTRDAVTAVLEKEAAASGNVSTLPPYDTLHKQWASMTQPTYEAAAWNDNVVTGIDASMFNAVVKQSCEIPSGFAPHDRLMRTHLQARLKRLENDKIDWATAEVAAFGSLAKEGNRVRLSGQDVERGTFSQRHLSLCDVNTGATHRPFGSSIELCNSPLSEESVLGYEFGWSFDDPRNLGVWEAQFGDFWNTAQVIFDTFVSSAIPKWCRQSSLVMSLPHGYDGAGPEHSSSRVERILQQCASADMSPADVSLAVAQPSTPAQMFHLLRRQMLRNFRVPLVVVGPKTLLRLPEAVSSVKDMTGQTTFETVLDDPSFAKDGGHAAEHARVVILCAGKVYYDLVAQREALNKGADVAIVRIEELWPLPVDKLHELLNQKYVRAERFVWMQEEPRNQGAWMHVQELLSVRLGVRCEYVGRRGLSVAAVGAGEMHKAEVAQLQQDIRAAMQ